jgi:tight adherence protein B
VITRIDPGLTSAAAGLAAAAAWLVAGARPAARRLVPRHHARRGLLQAFTSVRGRAVAGIGSAVALAAVTGPVPGVVAALTGFALSRRVAAARRRRMARAARVADLSALRAFAAELASGLPPADALRMAVGPDESQDGLRRRMLSAAAADRAGGEAAEALRGDAPPGSPAAALAAAWSVCQLSGTSLAGPVKRLAEGAAADLRLEREADAALASARASARLLAVLPLAGVLLGQLSGTGSVRVLLTTGVGQACLVVGTVLDLAGLAWLDRLADAAGA